MRACNQTRTSAYIKLKLGEYVPEISIGVSGISSNALTSPVLSSCPTLSLSLQRVPTYSRNTVYIVQLYTF